MRRLSGSVVAGAALAFFVRGVGASLAFALNVATARLIGAEGTGHYYLAVSITITLSVVARMGLDNSMLRFISTAAAAGEWGRVKGVFRLGMRQGLAAALILAVAVGALAGPLANAVFDQPGLETPLRIMSVSIVTYSAMALLGECLKGLRRVGASMLVAGALYPAFALLAIWPMTQAFGAAGASLAYVFGTAMSAATGFWLWSRALAPHPAPAEGFPRSDLQASSRPLWVTTLVNGPLINWMPILYAGLFVDAAAVGVMAASLRLTTILTFFSMSAQTVASPTFSVHAANRDWASLQASVSHVTTIVLLSIAPVCLALVALAEPVMAIFGPEFRDGAPLLVVLAVSHLLMAMAGPGGHVLALSGHERQARTVALMAGLVTLVVVGVLTPLLGTLGAVIGVCVASVADRWGTSLYARRLLGINCFATPATLGQGLGRS